MSPSSALHVSEVQAQHINHIYCRQFPKEIASAKGKGHLENPNSRFQSRYVSLKYSFPMYMLLSLILSVNCDTLQGVILCGQTQIACRHMWIWEE